LPRAARNFVLFRPGRKEAGALLVVRLTSPRTTRRFGQALGRTAQGGEVLELHGVFGAGKTTLAQGVLRGLLGPGIYRSPSFDLIHAYPGRADGPEVFHVDLDRVGEADLETIGLDDLFEARGVVIVEHGEVARGRLPVDRLVVRLARGARARHRVAGVQALGPRARGWLRRALPQFAS